MHRESWTISNNLLSDGVTYALKNSDNLYKSAKILFDDGSYVHALAIATLALEEFGKHCILKEHWMGGEEITADYWDKIIKKHEEKLKAIPKHLEQAGPNVLNKQEKKELVSLKNYLLDLARRKLENLYVDWDNKNSKWLIVENSESIKKKAEFAVKTAHWVIEKYIEDLEWDRELLFTPMKEIISLFRERKIHAFCKICSIIMITPLELIQHKKIYPNHLDRISWHYND